MVSLSNHDLSSPFFPSPLKRPIPLQFPLSFLRSCHCEPACGGRSNPLVLSLPKERRKKKRVGFRPLE